MLAELKAIGLEPVCYIAYQTVVVRKTANFSPGAKLPETVDWVGPYLPEYKLAPEIRNGTKTSLLHQPIVVTWPGELITGQPADLMSLARDEGVAWIESRAPLTFFNRDVQWVLQTGWDSVVPNPLESRRIWRWGIRGQGMIVGLFDSGVNPEHDMFRDPWVPLEAPGIYPSHRKIIAYKLYRSAAFGDELGTGYHGSAVAGTLTGNDTACGNLSSLDGLAPDARLYFLDIATASGEYLYSDNLTEMLDSIRLSLGMTEPVRQVSGSFGTMDNPGYYRLAEATVDAVCWQDKRFLVIWAAGNGGGQRYRIGHPSGAKNCLTVGGCGNGTRSNLVYSLSSAGPTRDQRIKPNVVAPAESVWTVDGAGVNGYSVRQGTSLASPAVSGALILLRQYLKEGWFPYGIPRTGNRIEAPSAALLRAFAICGADTNVGSGVVPDYRVGWGRLNLSRIMHFPDDSVSLTFIDDTIGLETGQFDEYQIEIDRREPLKVVLAWTDTAAAPAAQIALVNDLNLELESPDGNRYRGNQFYLGQSIPNPVQWDERNVEEVCRISRPLVGTWKIRVYARCLYTVRQPYAVVIKAGIRGLPPAVSENQRAPQQLKIVPDRTIFLTTPVFTCPAPPGALLKVWDAQGRLVGQATSDQGRIKCRLRAGAGVYFYRLDSTTAIKHSGRIVLLN